MARLKVKFGANRIAEGKRLAEEHTALYGKSLPIALMQQVPDKRLKVVVKNMFRLRNVLLLQPLMTSFGFAERNDDRRHNFAFNGRQTLAIPRCSAYHLKTLRALA